MGQELYETQPICPPALDRCEEILRPRQSDEAAVQSCHPGTAGSRSEPARRHSAGSLFALEVRARGAVAQLGC